MYHICKPHPDYSFEYIQRCFFPANIPTEHYGKYAFLQTSDGNVYFVRICVNPDLKENICVLNDSVQLTPLMVKSSQPKLLYEDVIVVPFVNYIKTINVELVFKSVFNLGKWKNNNYSFEDIIKQILKCFVLAKDIAIHVNDISEFNEIGLHKIIIKNIGKITAGKIVESSKLVIDKKTYFERYMSSHVVNSQSVPGFSTQYIYFKELICCYMKSISQSSPLKYISSLKIIVIGPDGCGKKTLIKKVASDFDAVIVRIDGPELNRPLPGETKSLLKEKFNEAKLHCNEGNKVLFTTRPCVEAKLMSHPIIGFKVYTMLALCGGKVYPLPIWTLKSPSLTILLLARIESICSTVERILSKFLYLLDSIPPTMPLIVVATTSKPNLLHSSIRSSSRFHNRIFINIPSEEERCEMINYLCNGSLSNESILFLSKLTHGFVAADLNLLFTEAKRKIDFKSCSKECDDELLQVLRECKHNIEASSMKGELGVVKTLKSGINQLGGLENVKQLLTQSIHWPLLYPDVFKRFGIQKSSGVLLYGPPGCAKTSLVKTLATSLNVTFLSVSAADLYSSYVGDAEKTVTNLFQRARNVSPTLLFIDEIDGLVGNREDTNKGTQQERVLSTFLIEMDGIAIKYDASSVKNGADTNVIVIAATNRPDAVDSALLRPGRFDRLIYVPPPSLDNRLQILNVLTEKIPLSDCVQLRYIAEKTDMYSGADLKSVCQEAALQALISDGMDGNIVRQEHWIKALTTVFPSITEGQIHYYNKFSQNLSID